MKTQNIIVILLIGLAAGAASVYAPEYLSPLLFDYNLSDIFEMVFIFPGLFFALAACLCFTILYKQSKWAGYVGFGLISIVAYNLAYWATFFSVLYLSHFLGGDSIEGGAGLYLGFLIGGFIGGLAVALGLKLAVVKFSFKEVFIIALCSAVLGLSGAFQSIDRGNYLVLFLVWQTGMLLLIMYKAQKYLLPEIPAPN